VVAVSFQRSEADTEQRPGAGLPGGVEKGLSGFGEFDALHPGCGQGLRQPSGGLRRLPGGLRDVPGPGDVLKTVHHRGTESTEKFRLKTEDKIAAKHSICLLHLFIFGSSANRVGDFCAFNALLMLEVIHSPGVPSFGQQGRSGAVDNFLASKFVSQGRICFAHKVSYRNF